jgi:hypothetical protein
LDAMFSMTFDTAKWHLSSSSMESIKIR